MKSNLSGEFTVVNEYLVRDLKKRGLWDEVMVVRPEVLRRLAARRSTASREDLRRSTPPRSRSTPKWLVEAGARRQKWIDQAQSLNIYMAGASGKKLDETYKLAWLRGLKTTYYLRTMAATHVEKSTVDRSSSNAVPSERRLSAMDAVAHGTAMLAAAAAHAATDIAAASTTPTMRGLPVTIATAREHPCDASPCTTHASRSRACSRMERRRMHCRDERRVDASSMRGRNNKRGALSISAWCFNATLR